MRPRYEIAYSSRAPSLMLIVLEGGWETLSFEIRLSEPWCGSASCTETTVPVVRRQEIAQHGYSVGDASFLKEPISDWSTTSVSGDEQSRSTPLIAANIAALVEGRALIKVIWQAAQDLRRMRGLSKDLVTEANVALRAAADQLVKHHRYWVAA
jgi:hypothetical protein